MTVGLVQNLRLRLRLRPHLNHVNTVAIPTHFIPRMPPDMEMAPISRTIGRDQLDDEMAIKFTHTVEMDWMLPGMAGGWMLPWS